MLKNLGLGVGFSTFLDLAFLLFLKFVRSWRCDCNFLSADSRLREVV